MWCVGSALPADYGTLAEWLRRSPAKAVGHACVSSNLTGVVTTFFHSFFKFIYLFIYLVRVFYLVCVLFSVCVLLSVCVLFVCVSVLFFFLLNSFLWRRSHLPFT